MSIVFSSYEIRRWIRSYIYRIYQSRELLTSLPRGADIGVIRHTGAQIDAVDKKIQYLEDVGKRYGLTEEEREKLKKLIVAEMESGKKPKEIIKKFLPDKEKVLV